MHFVWIWLPQASEVCALLRVVVLFSNVCDVCLYGDNAWVSARQVRDIKLVGDISSSLLFHFHLHRSTKERASPAPRKGLSQADP